MPLTLFMAICILGCDVLIYFLFHWTLGEKSRTRRRRCGVKRRMASGQESQLFVVPAQKNAKILPYAEREPTKPALPTRKSLESRPIDEEPAYRRRAAAFASPKQNPKLAV